MRQLVSCSLRHAFGVNAENGALLWTQPFTTRYSVIAGAPVATERGIFVTAPDTPAGGKLFRPRLGPADSQVDTAWTTPLDTCHGGVVHIDDMLYGSWYRQREGWAAVDARTGKVRFERNDVDAGSVLWAAGRLYCLSQTGEMLLLKVDGGKFDIVGRFRATPAGHADVWAHPAICDGRLYVRYHDTLTCFDVRLGLLESEE